MNASRVSERGSVDGKLIGLVVLSLLFILAGSAAIWAFMNYKDAKDNSDSKVEVAKVEAEKAQSDKDEAAFLAREKEPMRQFASPDDYGHITFDYPKTWSVYQATVTGKSGATYAVYLNPIYVPPVPSNALSDLVSGSKLTPSTGYVSKFAVRLKVEQKTYDETLTAYNALVKTNQLKSSAFTTGSVTGTRFDGKFNGDITGSAVVIKMRDRTLTLRTDADVFAEDFNKLIKTIGFNE